MTERVTPRRHGSYGIDAPYAPAFIAVMTVVVLLMAAQRLTTGRAAGVDLWRSVDQSGNSLEATRRNAIAEGVADRVELHTGDMTALPFEDSSFDVVVSSLAIHNISRSADREKAIEEAVRVLR